MKHQFQQSFREKISIHNGANEIPVSHRTCSHENLAVNYNHHHHQENFRQKFNDQCNSVTNYIVHNPCDDNFCNRRTNYSLYGSENCLNTRGNFAANECENFNSNFALQENQNIIHRRQQHQENVFGTQTVHQVIVHDPTYGSVRCVPDPYRNQRYIETNSNSYNNGRGQTKSKRKAACCNIM